MSKRRTLTTSCRSATVGAVWDESNLQGLCRRCHQLKTAREKRKGVVQFDVNGFPLNPRPGWLR